MLRTLDSLNGYAIRATDDELGKVKEAYFDDEQWGVRYLVVETGTWLSSRRVLISPYSIKSIDDAGEAIHVLLTQEQVKNSPDIDTHEPVSRQLEGDYSRYFGYGAYWEGPYLWGLGGYPVNPAAKESGRAVPLGGGGPLEEAAARVASRPEDVHLRSSKQVDGYHVLGTDEDIGHVDGCVFDDEAWAIRYLLVDTRNWWPGGKKVLIATQWVDRFDWTDSTVQTTLTREQIKNCPEYDEKASPEREYEIRLHHYYDRSGYWE